jgi:hypothetical protein
MNSGDLREAKLYPESREGSIFLFKNNLALDGLVWHIGQSLVHIVHQALLNFSKFMVHCYLHSSNIERLVADKSQNWVQCSAVLG